MVINHYWVSWFQFIGLFVGLFGFFYLEIGIFGDKNAPWISALLPAFAMGLGMLLLLTSNSVGQLLSAVSPHGANWENWIPWAFAVTFFLQAWWLAAQSARRRTRWDRPGGASEGRVRMRLLDLLVGGAFWIIVTIGVTTVLFLSGEHSSDRLTNALHIGGGVVLLILGEVALFSIPRLRDNEKLRWIGFILSAIAILTQFIPPVLDLLNISVK